MIPIPPTAPHDRHDHALYCFFCFFLFPLVLFMAPPLPTRDISALAMEGEDMRNENEKDRSQYSHA